MRCVLKKRHSKSRLHKELSRKLQRMTNEGFIAESKAGNAGSLSSWRDREPEAFILNLYLCHVSQLDIFHSSTISGASPFDFLLSCFSFGNMESSLSQTKILHQLQMSLYFMSRIQKVQSTRGARQYTVKRPRDSGGFKNDPLREPPKPHVWIDKHYMQKHPF